MSHSCDEQYTVYRESATRARKVHSCDACGQTIPVGGTYYRVTWIYDGSADGCKRCWACQQTHDHLKALCWEQGEMWPDERLACGLNYVDEWEQEPPPEIAALAFWRYGDPIPCDNGCSVTDRHKTFWVHACTNRNAFPQKEGWYIRGLTELVPCLPKPPEPPKPRHGW